MTDLTTIKVSRRVRDRLAVAARARGVTMRALLEDLSQDAVDAALMDEVARQMAHLQGSDPDAWLDYLREGEDWEVATGERVDA